MQNILHDGMKVLEVTGPDGPADVNPIITTENLGRSCKAVVLMMLLQVAGVLFYSAALKASSALFFLSL